ncbi:MAG: hypothetical protein QOF30_3644 [Acidimicrobiaceae bacterium]|jgi:hypothetical protein|nr:hypothetical protein [Acidimicrobiaceae bacterium]
MSPLRSSAGLTNPQLGERRTSGGRTDPTDAVGCVSRSGVEGSHQCRSCNVMPLLGAGIALSMTDFLWSGQRLSHMQQEAIGGCPADRADHEHGDDHGDG